MLVCDSVTAVKTVMLCKFMSSTRSVGASLVSSTIPPDEIITHPGMSLYTGLHQAVSAQAVLGPDNVLCAGHNGCCVHVTCGRGGTSTTSPTVSSAG